MLDDGEKWNLLPKGWPRSICIDRSRATDRAVRPQELYDMDTKQLRVFEAVARLGSMARAAEELHMVQSNVTARIGQLEDELGAPLFRRHARGVELTRAGQRLLPYARQIANLLREARCAALDDGTPRGSLVIGSLETTAALHLTPLLSGFMAAHPDVDVILKSGTTCELLEQVVEGQLEGAFVCGPVAHPALAAKLAFKEELVLLSARPISSLTAFARRRDLRIVVLRRGCSYRQRLEDILARHGVPTLRILEFGTLEAIFSCVSADMGVTLLPRALIGPIWRSAPIAIHALPRRDGLVETVFVRRRDSHVSSALAAFLSMATIKLEASCARSP